MVTPPASDPAPGPGPDQQRFLVTRLRFLGDVVLSTPLLACLREARPNAWIEYLTYSGFAPALEHHPAVDRVLTIPPRAGLFRTLQVVRQLRNPRVDWYFDLLSNPRSALHATLARPRVSVGQQAGVRSRVYTHRRPRPRESQVVGHLDKLVPLLGAQAPRRPRLHVTDAERTSAAHRFGLDSDRPVVVLHPGATWPWRLWPQDRWATLAAALRERGPELRILRVTPPGIRPAPGPAAGSSGIEILPVLEIRHLMAVLSHADAYLGNDGGILHTAVALGVPTVGLFGGENDPAEWFPYESMGPFRAILRSSPERFRDARGRSYPRPDARVEEVVEALSAVAPGLLG